MLACASICRIHHRLRRLPCSSLRRRPWENQCSDEVGDHRVIHRDLAKHHEHEHRARCNHGPAIHVGQSEQQRRLQGICLALLRAPDHPNTLEDWAQQVGASSRTLARSFQPQLKMNFNAWRQQLCLMEALPRLLAGERVQSVAQDLGYGSARAFSAMYRRLLGEKLPGIPECTEQTGRTQSRVGATKGCNL